MPDPDRACEHPDFAAHVSVNRLTDTEGGPVTGYSADIKVSCAECGEPFRWTGVPGGLTQAAPRCSLDQLELRAPLRPASSDLDFGLGFAGFTINPTGTEDTDILCTDPACVSHGLMHSHPEGWPEHPSYKGP
jgi:hypothetical protein